MARARRGARPSGAPRSAELTDRWTGSDRLPEAEGEARTSGACGGKKAGPRGDRGGRAPGGSGRSGPRGTAEAGPRGGSGRLGPGGDRGSQAPGEAGR